jgi:hypothetical protein
MLNFNDKIQSDNETTVDKIQSQLRQWPIQLHLVSPTAPYYQGADVLLTADCVAYALGDFHRDYLQGKALAIACPKLDTSQEIYLEKIKSWIDDAKINTLTILIMQVPCCMGLLQLAQQAAQATERKVPVKYIVVGVQGDILQEEWASCESPGRGMFLPTIWDSFWGFFAKRNFEDHYICESDRPATNTLLYFHKTSRWYP